MQAPTKPNFPVSLRYLRRPLWVLLLNALLVALAATQLNEFRFDASSDTLVVEGDPDLLEYQGVVESFGGEDFIFMTFAPHDGAPLSPEGIATLDTLVEELRAVRGVKQVFSVLDAPLLKSPPVSVTSLLDGFPTLKSPTTDLALAQAELTTSPFFRELLITADGQATAIKIDLLADADLAAAHAAFEAASGAARETAALALRQAKEVNKAERETLVQRLRDVKSRFASQGVLFIGGVPMIAADMVSYVKNDLTTFGGAVLLLMIIALALFFQKVRWVVLPLLTAALTVIYTVGLLGWLGWQATVVSSNFVSLLGITTISLTIHLIVHYRELRLTSDNLTQVELVLETMRAKFAPCFYTALTTIAAFGSLTVSGILPVEFFGWMMCIGILISFFTTYTLFPAGLLLLPKGQAARNLGKTNNVIRGLGELSRWRPGLLVGLCVCIALAAYAGVQRVTLDNRFVEYFDEDTDIFQGMRFIDQNLGGTIPFDVVLSFPPFEPDSGFYDEEDPFAEDPFADDFGADLAEEDPFAEDDLFTDSTDNGAGSRPEHYWYSRQMLDRLAKVHTFVEAQPQVGKVLGLTALEAFAMEFTDGKPLDSIAIVAILAAIPDDLYGQIIAPYANPTTGELRISARIIESGPGFDREQFRQQIIDYAVNEADFTAAQVKVTGMMVLFNGMLSKLLDSQINTLAYILAVVFVMFLVLLRSLHHALLGMIPNTLASATVIGAMGYSGVPLDMMTTTIAAVCIGIGVDDTIHYLHRFREEYAKHGSARIAISFCHESIGRALYYTSFTVVIGFSILGFSNFTPTVMFGLWTAVAMLLALLANLTLLPAMLVLTHPDQDTKPEIRPDVAAD
ncbi:MAG: MMPL family transporter [Pseudomonadota bacterium]